MHTLGLQFARLYAPNAIENQMNWQTAAFDISFLAKFEDSRRLT
jgi:hypothetical protein